MTRAPGFTPTAIRQQQSERRLRHCAWHRPTLWQTLKGLFA